MVLDQGHPESHQRREVPIPRSLVDELVRHTAASLAVRAGANVKAVQRMLGHAPRRRPAVYLCGAGGARTHDPRIMSPLL